MKKQIFLYGLLIVFLLSNCQGSNYEFWELDQFHLDNSALASGEKIAILYTSRGPDYEQEDYYVHYVVVSQTSGDTINVLSNSSTDIVSMKNEPGDFTFYNENSEYGKLIISLESNEFKSGDKTIDELTEEVNLPYKTKIARDPSYDYIAKNIHPTVIGYIGKESQTK